MFIRNSGTVGLPFILIQNNTETNKLKGLIKYLVIREKSIFSLLTKTKGNYSTATFHQLRLELKKLNALLELIDNCTTRFDRNKWFKPFKLIFKKAGRVRDLQVGEELMAPYLKTIHHKEYRNLLQQEQAEAKQEFFKLIDKTDNKALKKAFQKFKTSLKELDSLILSKYLLRNEIKIKHILVRSHLRTENIHDLRKRLKKYYYNKSSLGYKKSFIPFRKAEALQELMGKWQDCFILTEHLNRAIKAGNIGLSGKHELKQVRKRISALKAILYKKIKTVIAKLHVLKSDLNIAA